MWDLNSAPVPGDTTATLVVSWSYPVPESIILTSFTEPFSIMGTSSAPIPLPFTVTSGELS